MIDIVDALDLLDSCVRSHGQSHRSPTRPESAARASRDGAAGQAVADSIVALAIARAGAPTAAVSRLTGASIGAVYDPRQNPLNLTLGAAVVLGAAESVERRGETWAAAVQAARQAGSRFLELLPDGIVERAAPSV